MRNLGISVLAVMIVWLLAMNVIYTYQIREAQANAATAIALAEQWQGIAKRNADERNQAFDLLRRCGQADLR